MKAKRELIKRLWKDIRDSSTKLQFFLVPSSSTYK